MLDKYFGNVLKKRLKKLLPLIVLDIALIFFFIKLGVSLNPMPPYTFFDTLGFCLVISISCFIVFSLILGTTGVFVAAIFSFLFVFIFFTKSIGLNAPVNNSGYSNSVIPVVVLFPMLLYYFAPNSDSIKKNIARYYPHLSEEQVKQVSSQLKPALASSKIFPPALTYHFIMYPLNEWLIITQKLIAKKCIVATFGKGKERKYGFLQVENGQFAFYPFSGAEDIKEIGLKIIEGATMPSAPAFPVTHAEGTLNDTFFSSKIQLFSTTESFEFKLELPYFEQDIVNLFYSAGVPINIKSNSVKNQTYINVDAFVDTFTRTF